MNRLLNALGAVAFALSGSSSTLALPPQVEHAQQSDPATPRRSQEGSDSDAGEHPRSLEWAEILERTPDPEVIVDSELRARLVATGYPWKVRERKSGIVLLLVPPGEFLRGAGEEDPLARINEHPQHIVRIRRPFYLGQTEVTRAEWNRLMPEDPSPSQLSGNQPVQKMTIADAEAFLESCSLELPRESEWEYAARAGETGHWYGELAEIAWTMETANDHPRDVGAKLANAWGFQDVLGNVWELTGTWYDGYDEYPAEPVLAAEEDDRIVTGARAIRGGSFGSPAELARLPLRASMRPERGMFATGFRAARHLPEAEPLVFPDEAPSEAPEEGSEGPPR